MNRIFLQKISLTAILLMIVLGPVTLSLSNPLALSHAQATPSAQQTTILERSCGWTDVYCYLEKAANWLASLILSLTAGILLVSGYIFDNFLYAMVTNFISTFQVFIGGIKIGWQLGRDFANIAIIGVFVFTAIMTILGRADYGAKALVAKILIVAILINFSFLFTNIIIQSTNLVSQQLWRTMSTDIQKDGTAQTFLNAFGIKDWWVGTDKLTADVSASTGRSWAGLLYAFVGGITLLAISFVFLYGAFIITARALLLLFAMLTSSIAFASFLLPNTAKLPYVGWSAWWSNLLKAAFFGPVMILTLFVVTTILKTANISQAGNALASVSADPSKVTADAWTQLIFLVIGTAMLFIAIRAASSFSSSIGGFNWGILAAAIPVALSSRLGGLVGQQTLGRMSYLAALQMRDASQKTTSATGQRMYDFGSRQFMKAASQNFNMLNNSLGKEITKAAGIRSNAFLMGKNTKGFSGSLEKKSDRFAKQAERVAPTGTSETAKAVNLDSRHEAAQKDVEETKKILTSAIQNQEKTLGSIEQGIKTMATQQGKASLTAANDNKKTATELQASIEHDKSSHKADMNQQATRIAEAKDQVLTAQANHTEALNRLQEIEKVRANQEPVTTAEIAKKLAGSTFTAALEKKMGMGRITKELENMAAKKVGENKQSSSIRQALAPVVQQQYSQPKSAPATPKLNDNFPGDMPRAA